MNKYQQQKNKALKCFNKFFIFFIKAVCVCVSILTLTTIKGTKNKIDQNKKLKGIKENN